MNKNYLNYLFRDKKIAVIFFFVIYIAIAFTPLLDHGNSLKTIMTLSLTYATVMSVMLCYALPVLLFANVQRKRSADLFLALPVSRKEQMHTNLLFSFILAFGYFLITSLLVYLLVGRNFPFINLAGILGHHAIFFAAMILVNSLFFLVANNIFDGIVMIASYSFLPLFLYIGYLSFMREAVVGFTTSGSFGGLFNYLSPVYLGFRNYGVLLNDLLSERGPRFAITHEAALLAWGCFAYFGVIQHFVKRKAERAEQISSDFFAYPFIIHIYMITVLLALFQRNNFSSLSVFYLLLFVIYIIATFVYKRKISVSWKNIVIFAAALIASIILSTTAWSTKGFGLAMKNPVNAKNDTTYYRYSTSAVKEDLGQYYEEDFSESSWVSIDVAMTVPKGKEDEYKEMMDIFEKYRIDIVNRKYKVDCSGSSNLCLSNYVSGASDGLSGEYYERIYGSDLTLSEEDLIKLDEKADIIISYPDKNDTWREIPLSEFLEERKGL